MRAGVFRKARRGAPAGFFAAEAAGLRWLAVDGGPRVAQVIDVGPDYLDLEEITPCRPTPEAAYAFGQALARLHRVPAPDGWGALPVEVTAGFFGPLDDPLPMIDGSFPSWPSFYAEARLRVIVEQGRKRGVFTKDDARQMEAVCLQLPSSIGEAGGEAPARQHGDLWSGNLMWTQNRGGTVEAVLIDPAAHVGHREDDLARLAMFGQEFFAEIVAGYEATYPLAAGWRDRLSLHYLYPMAAHAVLFGGHYIHEARRLMARWSTDDARTSI